MSLVLPGQVKPRGIPRINWAHPLAHGLVFYAFDTGDGEIVDLVSHRKATYTGIKPASAPSPFGQGFRWNNGGASFAQDSRIQGAQVQDGNTVFAYACAYMQTGSVGSFCTPFGRSANNNASQPFVNWDFEINPSAGGQNTARANCNNNSTIASTGNWTGNANNVYTTLVNNVYGGQQHFLAQGRLISQGASASGQVNTNADLKVGNISATGSPFVGFVYWGAFWSRPILSATLLHVDPYAFLIFPGSDLPIGLRGIGGGGGGGGGAARQGAVTVING